MNPISTLAATAPLRRPARVSWCTVLGDLLPPFDVLWLVLAALLAGLRAGSLGPPAWVALVLAPIMLYDARFGLRTSGGRSIGALLRDHALRYAAFATVLVILVSVTQRPDGPTAAGVTGWLLAGWAGTTLSRVVVAMALRHLQHRGQLSESVAVVGAGPKARRLVLALQGCAGLPGQRLELIGVFDDAAVGGRRRRSMAGTIAQLIELGRSQHIDWIVLAHAPAGESQLQALVDRLQATASRIALCPPHVGLAEPGATLATVGQRMPVGLLADRPIRRWGVIAKSTEDLVLGAILTLLLLPLLAVIALAIRVDSPGPILFRQRRHALDNGEFEILKFRTMRWAPGAAVDGLAQTVRGDPRVTRVGRWLRSFSLDELPQLFNVLAGQMSLVGPRPHATNMRTENRLGNEITEEYAHRHRVKPGITGWAQVNGARGATDTAAQLQRRVELDLHYVAHWSLLFDLKILALTWRAVLVRTNAF